MGVVQYLRLRIWCSTSGGSAYDGDKSHRFLHFSSSECITMKISNQSARMIFLIVVTLPSFLSILVVVIITIVLCSIVLMMMHDNGCFIKVAIIIII